MVVVFKCGCRETRQPYKDARRITNNFVCVNCRSKQVQVQQVSSRKVVFTTAIRRPNRT